MSAIKSTGASLAYVHKDGLIMRHDKEAFAQEAIESADGETRMQPVVMEGCVGCGVCEMICPVETAAIVIDLDKTADTGGMR